MITSLTFIILQLADFATTMIALRMGGVETSFLASRLMAIGSVQGLILSKVIILAIAAGALRARKRRVIRWANIAFGGVVLWNLLVIVRLALQARGA